MGFRRRGRSGYRKVFGHKSPFRRVFGSRSAGQAIGATYRTFRGPARDIAKLYAEVRGIKSRQNVEKKHYERLLTGTSGSEGYDVGQVSSNSDGIQALDVTPAIAQGIQHDQRVGNSLKMTGIAFKYQAVGNLNQQARVKLKFTLAKVSSPDIASVSVTEVMNMIWDENPLTNVRDTNAPLNYSTLKQNGIKIVRTHTCYVNSPDVASSVQAGGAKGHKTGQFAVSLQDVIRFINASATTPEGHKYFLFIQSDNGNASQSTDSTKTDIPVTLKGTGAHVRLHARYWWVDN